MPTPAAQTKPKLNPLLGLALAILGVSFSSILVRLSSAPALVTATLRLIYTVAILAPVVLVRHRAELKTVSRRNLLFCAASGFFLALHFWSWFESLKLTTVAIAATLCDTDAIFTAIGFAIFLKGRIPKLGIAAIGLTFCGAVVIALGAGTGGKSQLSGALLALLSAVFIATYLLIGSVQRAHLSTTVYTFLVYTACMITLLIACLFTQTPLLGWGWNVNLIALALAVVCTLMGHSIFSWCLRYLTPAFVGATKLAEPVLASLLAVILFGEVPVPVQIAGAVMVLAGILLYAVAENRKARKMTAPADCEEVASSGS